MQSSLQRQAAKFFYGKWLVSKEESYTRTRRNHDYLKSTHLTLSYGGYKEGSIEEILPLEKYVLLLPRKILLISFFNKGNQYFRKIVKAFYHDHIVERNPSTEKPAIWTLIYKVEEDLKNLITCSSYQWMVLLIW